MSQNFHGPAGPTQFTVARPHETNPQSNDVATPRHSNLSPTGSQPERQNPSTAPVPKPPRVHTNPIPTLGIPAVWYGIKKSFVADPVRPKLSKEERERDSRTIKAYFDHDVLEAEIAHAEETIKFLVAKGIHPVLSFLNIKSGAKTTCALYVGSIISEVARKLIIVIPATQNTATSTVGRLAGVMYGTEGSTISVRQLSARINEFNTYQKLSDNLPRTKHGLGIIFEDEGIVITGEQKYSKDEFDFVLRTLAPLADMVILDHGNDDIEVNSIGLHALRMSDVANFVCMVPTPISTHSMSKTIRGYYTDTDYTPPNKPELLNGERRPTVSKVRDSIVIAAGHRPTDGSVDFEELTRPLIQSATASSTPPWSGRHFVVPFDNYIADPQVSTCDLTKISRGAYLAYASIAIANLTEAARLQNVDVAYGAPQFKMPAPPAGFEFNGSGELVRSI